MHGQTGRRKVHAGGSLFPRRNENPSLSDGFSVCPFRYIPVDKREDSVLHRHELFPSNDRLAKAGRLAAIVDAPHAHPEDNHFLNLLRALVREPCVVGVEDAFFRVLRRELEEYPVRVSRFHGLLVAEGERPDSMYVSAHVDRHGLLCTGPNEFQYAAFIAGNRGELNGDSISEQFMELIAGRFRDQRVQAHSPFAGSYLGSGTITDSYVCPRRKNLIFEIRGLEFLQPGTPVSFRDRLQLEAGRIAAQLDNVISVAMLIEMIRLGFQGTALFTAGEESGRSWRYAAEWFQRHDVGTDRLIVLDTSPFPTLDDLSLQDVVLRNRDSNAAFDPGLTALIRETCRRQNIRYRFKDQYIEAINESRDKKLSLGRTELGRLITATGGAVTGTTIQLPTTSYHTATETANLHSVYAMLKLLMEISCGNERLG